MRKQLRSGTADDIQTFRLAFLLELSAHCDSTDRNKTNFAEVLIHVIPSHHTPCLQFMSLESIPTGITPQPRPGPPLRIGELAEPEPRPSLYRPDG